jgi:endonuclease G
VIYEVIGENDIAVPTHFFKVLVIEVEENKYDMEAYIIPTKRLDTQKSLASYRVSYMSSKPKLSVYLIFLFFFTFS